MKAINIVLNNFTNDSRVLKTTKSLLVMGLDISVVCLHEDGLSEQETIENLNVHRIKLKTRSWSKLKAVQLLKYAEFVWRVLKEYRKSHIYYCNDLSALPIGALAKLMNRGSKVIYDAHEYEINDVPNQSRFSIKLKYFVERFFIQFADEVITVSDSIAEAYKDLYEIVKPHVVLNCPVYRLPCPHNIFREKFNISSAQRIFLYQGGLAKGRGIEMLLQAFEESEDPELVLVCMGYGPLEALVQEKASASPNIYFHPAVSPEVLLEYTTSADFGILFYQDNCLNHKYCSPNKMFEYLMAGLPVIVSNLYEMGRLVKKHGIGSIANDNTVEGFKAAIQHILYLDYKKLRQNVETTNKLYNWEQQEAVLKKVYAGLLETGKG